MERGSAVTLADLVATLSLVSDLGMGRPVERVLRQTVIAMRLADLTDAGDAVRSATYYTSLLTWIACAADTSDLAALFGDEMSLFADTHDGDLAGMNLAMFMFRHLGRGTSAARRVSLRTRFVASGGRSVQHVMESHCQSASELAGRLGLDEDVCRPLTQAFERWDGRGIPGAARSDDLAMAARIVHIADCIEAFHFNGGIAAAVTATRAKRGTHFDPEVVDRFGERPADVLAGLDEIAAWDEVIALDPRLGEALSEEQLDEALAAIGDFADLKSPWRTGHSRGVAAVAVAAAGSLGLDGGDVRLLRRAAHVHDVGMIGVSSGVWDAEERWSLGQRERARTHPYLLERTFANTAALSRIARCAAMHHERLDGSGYPRGLRGDEIPLPARILAVADVHNALGQARPHRPAFDAERTEELLRDEARAGRLDGEVVNAVLRAGGRRVRRRADLPGGLTPREADVLVSLARGRTNPEIARDLSITRKTVSSHLEHVFTKLGVSTRTEAALFAIHHGLVDPTGPG